MSLNLVDESVLGISKAAQEGLERAKAFSLNLPRGYECISLDITADLDNVTHHGIDGVYYKPGGHPPYIIAEAKYGGSRLSYLKQDGKIKTAIDEFGNLFKRKQMDEQWIRDRLKDAVGKQKYRDILKVMEDGDVGSQLVNIKKKWCDYY